MMTRYPAPTDSATLLDYCLELGNLFPDLSDVTIEPGEDVTIETNDRILRLEGTAPTSKWMKETLATFPVEAQTRFEAEHDAPARLRPLSDTDTWIGMVRVHIWRANDHPILSLRVQPRKVPRFADLGGPPELLDAVKDPGTRLGFYCGPTRSGKTWLMHAAVDDINLHGEPGIRALIVGDPPEFTHTRQQMEFYAREIGMDTPGYDKAMQGALRVKPHIVIASELRGSTETTRTFIEMGQMSIRAFAGYHVNSVTALLNRLITPFPGDEKDMMRDIIAQSISFIVNCRLVPALGGGKVLATEFLRVDERTRETLKKPNQLFGAIENKRQELGCWTLEDDLVRLAKVDKLIDPAIALKYANDRKRIEGRL